MLEDLLVYIGIEDVRPMGQEIQARCPAHEKRTGALEHRPDNWSINRVTGKHHCFSCGYAGSLPTLVVEVGKVGLWEAHRLIREHDVELHVERQEDWQPLPSNQIEEQLEQFGPPPERALERRHLTRESTDRFAVRWDYENSAWVLPICGPGGALWGYQFKASDYVRNKPPGVKKSRTLFGLSTLQADRAIVVESPLDAVYMDSLGYPAVASFGANISDIQMRLLMERCDEIMLALDNDQAGDTETKRLLKAQWHHRIPVTVFHYIHNSRKDPGECTAMEVHAGVEHASMAAFW